MEKGSTSSGPSDTEDLSTEAEGEEEMEAESTRDGRDYAVCVRGRVCLWFPGGSEVGGVIHTGM